MTPDKHDATICQRAAEALWLAATSNDHKFAFYRSPVYTALERAFKISLREVYGLRPARVNQVRDLLAEYGPNDSIMYTSGHGVASYVEFALSRSARHQF